MNEVLTSQSAVRAAFWRENPQVSRKRIKHYSGYGTMYTTDTRAAFVDWLDHATRERRISQALAQRVTLEK